MCVCVVIFDQASKELIDWEHVKMKSSKFNILQCPEFNTERNAASTRALIPFISITNDEIYIFSLSLSRSNLASTRLFHNFKFNSFDLRIV